MDINNLQEKPEFFDQVINLVEDSFGYNENNSFLNDFYPLINNLNHSNCWILQDNNKLVGHIGVRTSSLNNNTNFAMMGGIAINPDYRGQGLFNDFFREIVNKYKNFDFIILWSDKSKLYKKFGFDLTGNQYTLLKVDGMQSTFEKVKSIDDEIKSQVAFLYKTLVTNELAITRSKQDWNNIWNITSSDLYIAKNRNDILSYFFMNKGQDLNGIIHEAYFATDHHLEAAVTLGSLWLPHQYKEYAEFDEKLGLIKFNKAVNIDKLWISGLDSI